MATELATLVLILDEAFDRKAWHGPNLRGSIRGVTASEASHRPARGRHSIREEVIHAAYWKYAVVQRIVGGKRGAFPLEGSNWFPQEKLPGSWKEDISLLQAVHTRLRETVLALSPGDLDRAIAKHTVRRLIYGAALHDVYHAAQIQLVKRLLPRRS
jgi:hypothetical protein